MLASLNSVVTDFIGLLYPAYCYSCEKSLVSGEAIICTNCRLKLPYIPLTEKIEENPLMHRFYGKVPVSNAVAFLYFRRSGRVQKLLHALKYKGIQEIGVLLGQWFGASLKANGFTTTFDMVVPVPLHRVKLQKRGYNQADSFAQGLAEALGMEWDKTILKRTKNTETQTNKSRPERWENVGQVFEVTDPAKVNGKKIFLVDDVITTGATLEACTITLMKAGCAEVSVGAIAAA